MEIPRERRVILVATFVGVCVLALAFTLVAMKSLPIAIAGWGAVVGLTMLFIEPFIGLVNYLAFLYIRPQDFVPALQGMPIMLMLGVGTAGLVFLHRAVRHRALVLAPVPQHLFVLWFYVAIVVSQMAHMRLHGALTASLEFV